MEVVSLCPLRASSFVWQAHSGAHALTVVVKATFVLSSGECSLAPEQEPVNEVDEYWNDDPSRSIVTPSDNVPYKPRADVLLVGHAYAPAMQPARSVMTRLVVGEIDKSIEVFCDRGFRVHDGQILEGARFTKMPLRWERAAGGPDTANPAGMRFEAPPDAYGVVPVPNLQPPGLFVSKRSDTFAPIGYGPIAPSWPGRAMRVGRAGTFPLPGWQERPLPEGLDPAFFQSAPPDQLVAEIRPNERIVLEYLHPDHPLLVTSLPGLRPKAIAERSTGKPEEVQLVGDTLWIDTDRRKCVVVWRGRIGLWHASEAGRISVTLEEMGEGRQTALPSVPDEEEGREITKARTYVPGLSNEPKPVMPFRAGKTLVPNEPPPSAPTSRPMDAGLPFAKPRMPSSPDLPPPAVKHAPYSQAPAVPPKFAAPPPVASAPPPVVSAPPPVVSAPPPVVSAKAPVSSPWVGGASAGIAPPRETIGAVVAASAAAAVATPSADRATQEGAVAASNAAANVAPWSAPKREKRLAPIEAEAAKPEAPRELLELLWYDPDAMARIRRVPAWKQVIAEIERSPRSRKVEVVDGAREPWEIEDRHEIFQILAKAQRTDGRGVEDALDQAVGEDGKFVPPLVLVAGEIELPFDELETLKAAMSTTAPLVTPADEQLKAAVGVAKDFVQTPGLSAAPAVSEGLTTRIRDAFSKEKKSMPADYLDTQVERVLLSGRHYQKREVLGGRFLRCLVWLSGDSQAIVAYLPEDVAKKLPMWRKFRARLIAEVRPPQDQYEPLSRAMRVLGLARASAMQGKG